MRLKALFVAAVMVIVAALAAPAAAQETRTWRAQTTNGWFPKLSPDGRHVAYGFWATRIADLATGTEREVKAPTGSRMNPAGWVDNSTLIAHTEDGPANVYRISLSDYVPVPLGFDGTASWSSARDGHWATSLAGRPYTVRDGQAFRADIPQYGPVQLAGDYTVVSRSDNWNTVVFNGDQVARELPPDNRWTVDAEGDVATGYFGRVHLYPAGQGHVDATLSPRGREGVPALVRVGGQLWLWSQIEDEGENGLASVIGRRAGEDEPILLRSFPAVEPSVVWNGSEFVIAGNGTDGSMQVRWVPADAARTRLVAPEPPPAPEPEPPPAPEQEPASLLDIIERERAKLGHPMTEEEMGSLMNRAALEGNARIGREEWGLSRKNNGAHCPSPAGNIACDILHHRPTNQLYDVLISSDGPNWMKAQYHGDPEGRPWVAPVQPDDDDEPNLAGFVAQRWADLGLDAKQAAALERGGKDAVTRLHGCFTVSVGNELKAKGVDVGLEFYHNPWPGTDVRFSNDILFLRGGGQLRSVDIIAGKPGTDWTQGEPAWIVNDSGMDPADWRDLPVDLASLPCAALTGGGEPGGGGEHGGGTTEPGGADLDAMLGILASMEARLALLEKQHAEIMAAIAGIPKAQVSDGKIDELVAAINQERVVTFRLLGQNVTAVIKEGKK
jgi:hypothetical protein